MSETVTARFRWTADEILNGYRWHSRQRPFLLRILPWAVSIGFVVYGVVSLFSSGILSSIPLILFGPILLIFTVFIQPWILRRQFAKRPDRDTDIEWHVAPDRIHTRNSHGTSEFAWAALAKVVQTPEGFLFYPNAQIFHWVPRSGLAADADFQRLSDLARSHAPTFQTVA